MQNGEQPRDRFSKFLTQVEAEKRIIVFPLNHVPGIFAFEEGRLTCMDVVSGDGAWSFLASFIKDEEIGNVVSISWPQFASEKGLKANDEVSFFKQAGDHGNEEEQGPWKKFRIQVRRQIRLFGQNIWGDLMV
ncbi:hypothetical protein CCACVL1_00372 [Corchorus capsularis]|uniref:TF-B3 domain-containing protein n=1 Tax=Corchorus capsularis TaxID=210143 RepID=A0A1R3KX72_COCAP|nr:hypothetical protein CCACVL1_00372 [Corchorus capsularis]